VRWHTATVPALAESGQFALEVGGVALRALVVAPGRAPALSCRVGRREYRLPFYLDRLDEPLEQRREPFVEGWVDAPEARFLSLFRAGRPAAGGWTQEGAGTWHYGDALAEMAVSATHLSVRASGVGRSVALLAPPTRLRLRESGE